MGIKYEIRRGDKAFGPYSHAEYRQLVADGKLKPTDLIREQGRDHWVPISQISELGAANTEPVAEPGTTAPLHQPQAGTPVASGKAHGYGVGFAAGFGAAFLVFVAFGLMDLSSISGSPDRASRGTEFESLVESLVEAPNPNGFIVILQFDERVGQFGGDSRTITCKVQNTSNRLCGSVFLKSVYYDANDRIVGTGLGNAMNIVSGGTKTIDIMAMDIDNPIRYEIEVELANFD